MKEKSFEKLRPNKFSVISYGGSPAVWEQYGKTMQDIHRKITDKKYSASTQQVQLRNMEKYISEPETRIFFLTDKQSKTVVGFTYLYPTDIEPEYFSFAEQERQDRRFSLNQYLTMQLKTAEVGWTEILEAYRHQEGWSLLMDNLDYYLATHPFYETQVRVVTQQGNYSQTVAHRYKNNIIYRLPFTIMKKTAHMNI